MSDYIKAGFENGNIKTEVNASDKHLDDVIMMLIAERTKRRTEGSGTDEDKTVGKKLKRFFKRMYLTVRYHKDSKSKCAAAAAPVGIIEERIHCAS